MRRTLFALGAVVSPALFAGVGGAWARSHVVRDYAWVWLAWPADAGGPRCLKLDADSGGGQLEISWHVWTAAERDQLRLRTGVTANSYHRTFKDVPRSYTRSIPPTAWNAIGFGQYSGPTHSSVCLPYWSAALLTAGPPVAWAVVQARRRRLMNAGRCLACGYDLRATPDRCPECGKVVRSEAVPEKTERISN